MTLEELRDKAVTPEMLVAAGCKWHDLQQRYGTQALIEFGFRWPSMLAAGFRGKSLATLKHDQMAAVGLNACRMIECHPSVHHISSLGLSSHQLRELGWNDALWRVVGVNMQNMVDFGFSAQEWKSSFGTTDFRSLGFDTYSTCAKAGWRRSDIELALAPPPSQATTSVNHRSNRIHFI